MTDLSGDLTGLGWTILIVGGVLALLVAITCIVVIWAGTTYIDSKHGPSVEQLMAAQERRAAQARRQQNDDRLRQPGPPPARPGSRRAAQADE